MLYITTAAGQYLDQRLADFGITRPEAVGLSDDIFSQIGIQVKNRKQVRDLIDNLLDDIFGDEFVRAFSASSTYEPYSLINGDTLIVNFDEHETSTIIFYTHDFEKGVAMFSHCGQGNLNLAKENSPINIKSHPCYPGKRGRGISYEYLTREGAVTYA